MTNISKRRLDEDVLERLFLQLTGVLKIVGQKEKSVGFSDQFFTKSERIMFAKRLAAILLLDKEVPQHVVADKLSMSPTTVSKMSLTLAKGGYNRILEVVGSKKPRVSQILLEILFDKPSNSIGSMYRSHDYRPQRTRKQR